MGGTTDGPDVLGQWLASRQPIGGERADAPPRVPDEESLTEPTDPHEVAAPGARAAPTPVAPTRETSAPEPAAAEPAAPAAPERAPERAHEPSAEPASEPPARRVHPLAPQPVEGPSRPDVEFRRRVGTQRLAGALLLATLAGTAVVGRVAWERSSTTAAGVAAIGLLLSIGLWLLRVASTPPRVRVVHGVLEIEAHGERHTWDLANPHVRPIVRGRAGRRGWRVLLLLPERPPYVVDASVVNPRKFMAMLRTYRPDL